jgi:hypothetical protein
VYHEVGFRAVKVDWQKAIDGLSGLGEGARGAAYVTGAQWEEDGEESTPGNTHFSHEV